MKKKERAGQNQNSACVCVYAHVFGCVCVCANVLDPVCTFGGHELTLGIFFYFSRAEVLETASLTELRTQHSRETAVGEPLVICLSLPLHPLMEVWNSTSH